LPINKLKGFDTLKLIGDNNDHYEGQREQVTNIVFLTSFIMVVLNRLVWLRNLLFNLQVFLCMLRFKQIVCLVVHQ
jgi:hypothetical protein